MNKLKVSTNTIVRVVVAVVALANAVLLMLGKAPLELDENTIYVIVSAGASIVSTFWVGWKNNSFTPEAIIADELMKELKAGPIEDEEEIEVE